MLFARASLAQKLLEVPPLFAGEGALQNDSFLPGAAAPTKKITEGDRAFAKARTTNGNGDQAYDEALDDWHAALALGELDDAIVADADGPNTLGALCSDPDGSLARRSEAIDCAVIRRVMCLDPKLAGLWRARFEGLAKSELEACGSETARLARIEHDHPLTRSAARACLYLFDLAFEDGRFENARAWLSRARQHVGIAADAAAAANTGAAPNTGSAPDAGAVPHIGAAREGAARGAEAEIDAAIVRRTAALRDLELRSRRDREPRATENVNWETAQHVTFLAQVPLRTPAADEQRSRERHPRPGITFMGDDSVIVQSADSVYVVEPPGAPKVLDLTSSAAELTLTFSPTFSDPRSDLAAWPASDAQRVVVVAGRALGTRGNALLCLERVAGSGALSEWHTIWGFGDQMFHGAGAETRPTDDVLEPGVWEFQPGPVLDGERVLVQARQWTGEGSRAAGVDEGKIKAWCLALDLASGSVVWKRWLASGAVLDGTSTPRAPEARGAARPTAPLAVRIGRTGRTGRTGQPGQPGQTGDAGHAGDTGHVFVSTGVGIGSLLDSADGRLLWSVRSGRQSGEGSWSDVALAPIFSEKCAANAAQTGQWLWAPDDSNCVYRLRDGRDIDGRGIFARAPERLGGAEEVLGGDACQLVGWDAAVLKRSLWMEDSAGGGRWNSVSIEREESPPAQVWLTPGRALFATDRALYFCDRGRELVLLDRVPLPGAGRREQPALAVHRDRIYVADRSTLWIFAAR